MPLFIQKPIFWNCKKYQQPSGAKAHGGYPSEWGFGHEEWNNSPRLKFVCDGNNFRTFHTHQVSTDELIANAGQTFVFMTASHDGKQQLVGVAGNATGLMGQAFSAIRLELANKLNLQSLVEDILNVDQINQLHDQQTLRKEWDRGLESLTNWICPEEYFVWFEAPIDLNARLITGKNQLLQMYSRYTKLTEKMVAKFIEQIPDEQLQSKIGGWIKNAIGYYPIMKKEGLENDDGFDSITTKIAQVSVRLTQGKFRADLLRKWNGTCMVSGLTQQQILRASHVKPWRNSTGCEREDVENGLLLAANIDALFDIGLITFCDDGQMVISNKVSSNDRNILQIPRSLKTKPSVRLAAYLKFHRENIFKID